MSTTTARRVRSVGDAVGLAVAAQGTTDAFGVLGSGNLVITNALAEGGMRFHAARHENGAVGMADGFARVSGQVGVCSVHQGPGLTNCTTALTEAAKSRTPLLVLAGDTPAAALTSNFRIDQHGLVESVGAIADRVFGAHSAAADAARAYRRALVERRPVVLMVPIDLQAGPASEEAAPLVEASVPPLAPPDPGPGAVRAIAELLAGAERPAIVAGRGAVLADAGAELERLGELCGAVLATSAPAHGLFAGLPWALGIAGGFASPAAARLLAASDVILVVGASFNQWTTRHGELVGEGAAVAQVDLEPGAIGRQHTVRAAAVGDARRAARLVAEELERRGVRATGWRTPSVAEEIAAGSWAVTPYEDEGTEEWIDPRTLSLALERVLPAERAVAVDSGHFMGYPSMYLSVSDARAWVFANGFQAVGLGLGCAIGAAVARPERVTVGAVGDGGLFMALPELETAARLGLRLLVVVYDDAAYGAEVHHFEPMGHDVSRVRFPDADLSAVAAAAGCRGAVVRRVSDLAVVEEWLQGFDGRPLVLDAKVNPGVCAAWLAEAFRGG